MSALPVLPPIPVSVVVITKDEERAIHRCISSLGAYAEVFVVDSHSADRTAELATAAGATVVPFTWDGRYPKKKQWALENLPLAHDWVLYLDGDEYVTPEFDEEVRRVVAAPEHAAYDVPLDYVFLGRTLRHGHKVRKRVLFDRRRCAWEPLDDLSVERPFEMELHVQPTVAGTIGVTDRSIVHDDLEPLTHYFDRHNRYSDWEAVLRQKAERADAVERTARGKLWAKVPFKPLVFFLFSFVARQGFRDGSAGFHYALANSFYYWQIGLKTRQLRDGAAP
ncbi:glycosyltransferase family 2 protein [Nocardioides sp. TRM66260-LWL]|uniref:glycosyltransferase family 2 protein n=1 Tax=Nocardioides sp. TRM66260-LWL TaxID=2874478 RepID=UPI001CC7B1C7|nr:glycosyltransferase family 2 protein [Nocardioides sp. TRM66260-LWL]MBZ5734896.1 glycosyltransferase family 2 protein [Nocardioides sp. TRM66260-LWL]